MGTAQLDPRLVFDADSHRYTFDGRELISVTQALKAAGLVDPRWWTDTAALRGTHVHACLALVAEGNLDESSIDPEALPYVNAARAFLRDTGVTIEVWEQPVCDPIYGYAGTVDAIVSWPDTKRLMLIDWKSGGFAPSTGPQTAAYLRCVREWYPANRSRISRAGLQLRADGTYRYHELTDLIQDEGDFLSALRVAYFQQRHGLIR